MLVSAVGKQRDRFYVDSSKESVTEVAQELLRYSAMADISYNDFVKRAEISGLCIKDVAKIYAAMESLSGHGEIVRSYGTDSRKKRALYRKEGAQWESA